MGRDKVSKGLLAEREDEPAPEVPAAAGIGAAGAQPAPAAAVPLDTEDARAAVGAGNLFHGYPQDFTFRLVLILVAELRADFRRTELADLADALPEFAGGRHLGKAELADPGAPGGGRIVPALARGI